MKQKKTLPKKKPAIKKVIAKPAIAKHNYVKTKVKVTAVAKRTVSTKEIARKKALLYGDKTTLKHIKGIADTVSRSKHDGTKTAFVFEDVGIELTDRVKTFCMNYVELWDNGRQAAIKTGYSENSAAEQASRLLNNANVKKFIDLLKKDIGLVIGVSAYKIAREYAKIGFVNMKTFFNEDGGMKNVHDIDDDAAAAIGSIQIEELYEYQGRDVGKVQIGWIKRLKPHNKVDALDKLAKMIGADGVTKVANVNKDGEDVAPPLSGEDVEKILTEVRKIKAK